MEEPTVTGSAQRRWLIISPEIQAALLVALLRRAGGSVALPVGEILETADVTWTIEAMQDPEAAGQLLVRLRQAPT